ncbi:hypothetical protein [Kribbella deserti]|uniref:Prenyltransferase n=1 Tax=Kribbella deserti TaxID=1926257 RepID=A0ABV6QWD2_9ACTN
MTYFETGRDFIRREGRLLEQRLFATIFEQADPTGVVDALRGYQNPDGGFGHGLEPDKRCPDSLALDVEVALQNLAAAGMVDVPMVSRAADWLQATASSDGAVALASSAIEAYPRAEHWSDWAYAPGLNPTAGIAGLLHQLGIEHPWLDRATEWCWSSLEAGLPEDGHALLEVTVFLEHVPDRERAESYVEPIREWLPKVSLYRADADDPSYGVTPLWFAPTPSSLWRRLFTDEQIQGHLDRLERDQQPDGGWALTWQPPGQAATLEYRGVMTLKALEVLRAYS